ncbi:MAG: GtrA family protein [Actinomycetota bacterium]|nr:GtrA family protein [Actinomycetota bacterium]
MSVGSVIARAWALRHRLVRFAGVSVVGVFITQALLILFNAGLDWAGVPANIAATSIAAIPIFLMHRTWVWGVTRSHSVGREIVPFWSYTLLGLAVSTAFVAVADSQWGSTLAVSLANLTGWVLLWFGKFVLLERFLFREADDELSPTVA